MKDYTGLHEILPKKKKKCVGGLKKVSPGSGPLGTTIPNKDKTIQVLFSFLLSGTVAHTCNLSKRLELSLVYTNGPCIKEKTRWRDNSAVKAGLLWQRS